MKKTIYSIVLTLALIVSTVTVYASNDTANEYEYSNLEQMTQTEVVEFSKSLVEAVLSNDKTPVNGYTNLFTSDVLTKIYGYIVNNDVSGNIQSIVVDWVYPKYSSTGDSIIMLNAKIQNNSYNNLYLFELHINADGKIYGYNVWAY